MPKDEIERRVADAAQTVMVHASGTRQFTVKDDITLSIDPDQAHYFDASGLRVQRSDVGVAA